MVTDYDVVVIKTLPLIIIYFFLPKSLPNIKYHGMFLYWKKQHLAQKQVLRLTLFSSFINERKGFGIRSASQLL